MTLKLSDDDCIQINNEKEFREVFPHLYLAKRNYYTVEKALIGTTYPIYVFDVAGYGLALTHGEPYPINVWTNKPYNILTLEEALNR